MKALISIAAIALLAQMLQSCSESDQPSTSSRTVEDHGSYQYVTQDGQTYFDPKVGYPSGSMSGIGNH